MAKKLHVNGLFDIPVDETLTESGKAADAAVVGEKIGQLSEKIANMGGGSGLPEGASAHQMLVTDAEGVAKWEDRTHYPGITERNICENVALTFSENADMGGMYMAQHATDYVPSSHDVLRVTWDGVEYVCQSLSGGMYGNGALFDPSYVDTGEPFLIAFEGPRGGAGALVCAQQDKEPKTHNVTVIVEVVTITKLPLEYVPTEEIPSFAFVSIHIGTTTAAEYQEMLNKVNGKKIVRVAVRTDDGVDCFIVCDRFETVLDKYIDAGAHEISSTVFYVQKQGKIYRSQLYRLTFYFNDGIVSNFSVQYPHEIYLWNMSTFKKYAVSVDDNGALVAKEFS